ncbi:MAG: hypothetical protein IID44_14695 [Planctomycetes bacterium]|nr:hypothetical protein [Planctomycetota bacterium]
MRKHRSRERPVNAGVRGFFCWRSFPLARRFRAMFSGVAINGRHQLESAILGLSFQTEGWRLIFSSRRNDMLAGQEK